MVLHIESSRQLYGGALQVAMLIEGLTRRGAECHLACPIGSAIADAARPHASAVHETVMRGDVDIATFWRLRLLICQIRPGVVCNFVAASAPTSEAHSPRASTAWPSCTAGASTTPSERSR